MGNHLTDYDEAKNGRPARKDVPRSPGALVARFHSIYGLPNRLADGGTPTLDFDRLDMRMNLIGEEFTELVAAVYGPGPARAIADARAEATAADEGTRDLVETADALADLVYVIYGLALEAGIDLDRVLAAVQHSNETKLAPDGSVLLRTDGKVLKGPDFEEPDIRGALD